MGGREEGGRLGREGREVGEGGWGREGREGGREKEGGREGVRRRDDCYTYYDGTTILLEWTTSLDSSSGTLIILYRGGEGRGGEGRGGEGRGGREGGREGGRREGRGGREEEG